MCIAVCRIQKKFWGNWYVVPFKTVPTRDIRNSVHEKVTELYVTEFGGIPPEFYPIPHGIRNRRK